MKRKKIPPCCFRVGGNFHLYNEEGLCKVTEIPPMEELIVGVPFRTLSLEPFSFPFTHRGRIRDALAMQYRHLLPNPETVDILPLILSRKGKQARGVAWIWSKEEGETPGKNLQPQKEENKILYWPLPLLFMALPEKDPEYQALVCKGEKEASLLVFKEGFPFSYRYSRTAPSEEFLRRELGEDLRYGVVDPANPEESPEQFWHRWSAFWNAYPQLHEMNLSPRGVASLFAWDERLTPVLRALGGVLGGGAFFTALLGYSLYQTNLRGDIYEEKMRQAYGSIFPKDRIRDPLSQARGKLRALGTPGEKTGLDLEEILLFLGETWKDLPPGILAETLRFTSNGAEVVGSAPEVSHVQKIKNAFPQSTLQASLEDIQQIPGSSSVRFTLYLEAQKQ